MVSSEGAAQRTAPATTLAALLAALDSGHTVELCFLFDEPRGGAKRNWIGINNPVQILRQSTIDNTVVIEGVRQNNSKNTYVTVSIDIRTGDGYAILGAAVNTEDLIILEVSFAAINEVARTKLTVK